LQANENAAIISTYSHYAFAKQYDFVDISLILLQPKLHREIPLYSARHGKQLLSWSMLSCEEIKSATRARAAKLQNEFT